MKTTWYNQSSIEPVLKNKQIILLVGKKTAKDFGKLETEIEAYIIPNL